MQEIIEDNEDSLIATRGPYSDRLRYMFFDHSLVEMLWNRLEPLYGSDRVVDGDGQGWKANALNPYFRFCKYRPGDDFGPHNDGRRMINVDEQSSMTVNIYLATVPESHGGATRVLENAKATQANTKWWDHAACGGNRKCVSRFSVP